MLNNYIPTKKNQLRAELNNTRILIKNGKHELALKELKKLREKFLKKINFKFFYDEYIFDVESIIIALSEAPTEQINLIKENHKEHRFKKVLDESKKLLNFYPESFTLISIIGATYSIIKQYHKSLEVFQKLTELYPFSFKGHFDLALTYDNLGDDISSIKSYKTVIMLNPSYFDTYINLGDIFLRQEKYKEAKEIYSKALSLNSESPIIFFKIGRTFLGLNNIGMAKRNFKKSIEIDPNFYVSLGELSILNYQNGNKLKAFCQIQKLLKYDINNENYLFRFGKEILSKHSFDDGVIVFSAVLNTNPNSIMGNLFLGRCLYELGEFEQAINSFSNVTKLDRNNEIAINNLSFLFLNCNKFELIEKFIIRDDTFFERMPIGFLTAQAIYQFSRYDLTDCKLTLDQIWKEMNKPSSKKMNNSDEHFSKTYFNFIAKLIYHHSQLDFIHERENIGLIYHLGDSHCLSFSNLTLCMEEKNYFLKPLIITGLKAWHLSNNQQNRFKRSVVECINKIPHRSKIFISIGEIDCRIHEGIISFYKKSDKSLFDIIQQTIIGFVNFIEFYLHQKKIQAFYFGIPAPVISEINPKFWNSDQILLVEVVKTFNKILKVEVLKAGGNFLDIYYATSNKNGSSNKKYMIDETHLHPNFLENIKKQLKNLF